MIQFKHGIARAKLLLLFLLTIILSATSPTSANPFISATIAPGDGWATKTYNAVGEPSAGLYLDFALTGGADPNRPIRIVYVTNRKELKLAAAHDDPAIIVVRGSIDLNQEKTAADYAAGTGYDFDQYQQAYLAKDGRKIALQEDARATAAAIQAEQCIIPVGSNKSIVGEGDSSIIRGGSLILRGSNVIIRNLTFEDALDFFPRWEPADAGGNWNAAYDAITLSGARNVWVDHCTFIDRISDTSDGALLKNANGKIPLLYRHDGLIDIVNGSDFVTVSYNLFVNHERTILIGARNNNEIDTNKLRVTLHHNHFVNCRSRSPFVRYGKVHIYNNWYEGRMDQAFGTRFAARIFSEGNYFDVAAPVSRLAGYSPEPVPGMLFDRYSLYKPVASSVIPINLALEADLPLGSSAGWNPNSVYLYQLDITEQVPEIVGKFAGVGRPARN